MAIQLLDNDDYWKVKIKWEPSRKWYRDDEYKHVYLGDKDRNEYGIYRFERRLRNQKSGRENLYIGIAYRQVFDKRLHQGFHEWMLRNVKRGQIWVSVGKIDLRGTNHTRRRYEEIEAILIYFTKPTQNDRKKYWLPECYYEIKNIGYRGPLPEYIKYPLAEIVY